MKQNARVDSNAIFAWIAAATGVVLLVPLAAMQLGEAVNWTPLDFVVMGALLFGAGSVYVLVARRISRRHRGLLAVVVAAVLFYLWAELAVGIFFSAGS